jgi:hypothetical protein
MADSVFGDLGGGVSSQLGGAEIPSIGDGPHNALGKPSNNPSGGGGQVPAQDSVFGDLGGGVSSQTGGAEIPNIPGRDPGGQGGR